MNAAIGAIIENLEKIRLDFSKTDTVFSKDTKNTGDSKEISITEFLKSFFPTTYTIKKGKIYSLDSESQEIDCVILHSIHPRLFTPKREVILAEGVYAAIEIKPDIRTLSEKSEFHRGLKQIRSVRQLQRKLPVLFTEGNIPESRHRIPSIIFSKEAKPIFDTYKYIEDQVKNNNLDAIDIPDLIVVLDQYILFHSLEIENTLFSAWTKDFKGEAYIFLTSGEHTLLLFILILYCFKAPEPSVSDSFFIKEYIKRYDFSFHHIIKHKDVLHRNI